jgi:hypothetical protein
MVRFLGWQPSVNPSQSSHDSQSTSGVSWQIVVRAAFPPDYHADVVGADFCPGPGLLPHCHRTVTIRAAVLYSGDLAHGLMEAHPQDLNEEVNGVAGQVALGPPPTAVLEDQAGEGGQEVIARLLLDEPEGSFLEQGHQWRQAGGADLFTRPARLREAGCHSLFGTEVG